MSAKQNSKSTVKPNVKPVMKVDPFVEKMKSFGYSKPLGLNLFEKKINENSSYAFDIDTKDGACVVSFTIMHRTQFGLISTNFTTGIPSEKDVDQFLIQDLEKFVMPGIEAIIKNIELKNPSDIKDAKDPTDDIITKEVNQKKSNFIR